MWQRSGDVKGELEVTGDELCQWPDTVLTRLDWGRGERTQYLSFWHLPRRGGKERKEWGFKGVLKLLKFSWEVMAYGLFVG